MPGRSGDRSRTRPGFAPEPSLCRAGRSRGDPPRAPGRGAGRLALLRELGAVYLSGTRWATPPDGIIKALRAAPDGLARFEQEDTGGRPAERWLATAGQSAATKG
jgi:hypothetical protein